MVLSGRILVQHLQGPGADSPVLKKILNLSYDLLGHIFLSENFIFLILYLVRIS